MRAQDGEVGPTAGAPGDAPQARPDPAADPLELGELAVGTYRLRFRTDPGALRREALEALAEGVLRRQRPGGREGGEDEGGEDVDAGDSRQRGERTEDARFRWDQVSLIRAEDLALLAVAEGAARVRAAGVAEGGPVLVLAERTGPAGGGRAWEVVTDEPARVEPVVEALRASECVALRPLAREPVAIEARADALLPRFERARDALEERLEGRLCLFPGEYLELRVVEGGKLGALRRMAHGTEKAGVEDPAVEHGAGSAPGADTLAPAARPGTPGRQELDAWLDPRPAPPGSFLLRVPTADAVLLLGAFGSGKSTLLARWARDRWARGRRRLPLVADLATEPPGVDPLAALLRAARCDDTPAARAALSLLVRRGVLVPCFDGFDEHTSGLLPQELPGVLHRLLESPSWPWTQDVLVSCRDSHFPDQAALEAACAGARTTAYVRQLSVLPLDAEDVRAFVAARRPDDHARVLAQLERVYPLPELLASPLLLAMVLTEVDALDPAAGVTPAGVFEHFLLRWLAQTAGGDPSERELEEAEAADPGRRWTPADAREAVLELRRRRKVTFAEGLAAALWRRGRHELAWDELRELAARNREPLGGDAPLGLASCAFFARTQGDRYGFALRAFLEFFLARGLVRSLATDPGRALDTRPLSPEVVRFVGEVLARDAPARCDRGQHALESRPIRSLRSWLTEGRAAGAAAIGTDGTGGTDAALRASAGAAVNALRLLLGLARHFARPPVEWVPEGADLCLADLRGLELRGAPLARARLVGAEVSGVDLTGADLRGADLTGAWCTGAKFDGVRGAGATLAGADLEFASGDATDWTGVDVAGARLVASVWTDATWRGARGSNAGAPPLFCPGGAFAPGCGLSVRRLGLRSLVPCLSSSRSYLRRGHEGPVLCVAISGRDLATGCEDGVVRVWDPEAGVLRASIDGHKGWVRGVAFSPDGRALASCGDDGAVRLWDAESRALRVLLDGHEGSVFSVAFSPDGRTAASGGDDRTVRLWDPESGAPRGTLDGHEGSVFAVAFSVDGRTVASGSADRTARLWDVDAAALVARLDRHDDWVRAVALSPDGHTLASGSDDKTIRLWDARTGTLRARLEGHIDWVTSLAFSPDGGTLASGSRDKTIGLWAVDTGAPRARLPGHEAWVRSVAFSPDGRTLASGGADGTARLWAGETGAPRARLPGHEGWVRSVAFSPDGRALACGSADGCVRLWDAETGALTVRLVGCEAVHAVAFSPGGRSLASGGARGVVRVWDVALGELREGLDGHRRVVSSVAFSPDGRMLAAGGQDETILLWDVATSERRARLVGHQGWIRAVAFSPDGRTLASGGADRTVCLWDAETGALRARLEGHEDWVGAVAFSPDGRTVASGSAGVRLWDVETRAPSRTTRAQAAVRSIAFTPDGRALASAGEDKAISLWDAGTGALRARLEGHMCCVFSVSFSPDGRTLASGSADGSVRLWDVATGALLAVLEADGDTALARTPAGFFRVTGDASRLGLPLPRPDSPRTVLWLPLGTGVRRVLEDHERVRRALAGDLSQDDLGPVLRAKGWDDDATPWDGRCDPLPDRASLDAGAGDASPGSVVLSLAPPGDAAALAQALSEALGAPVSVGPPDMTDDGVRPPVGAGSNVGTPPAWANAPLRRPRERETFPQELIEFLAEVYASRESVVDLCARVQPAPERSIGVPTGSDGVSRWQGIWTRWTEGRGEPSFATLVRHVATVELSAHPKIGACWAWYSR